MSGDLGDGQVKGERRGYCWCWMQWSGVGRCHHTPAPVVDELSGAGAPQVNAEVASVVGLQRGVVGASLGGGQNLALEEGHYHCEH